MDRNPYVLFDFQLKQKNDTREVEYRPLLISSILLSFWFVVCPFKCFTDIKLHQIMFNFNSFLSLLKNKILVKIEIYKNIYYNVKAFLVYPYKKGGEKKDTK